LLELDESETGLELSLLDDEDESDDDELEESDDDEPDESDDELDGRDELPWSFL